MPSYLDDKFDNLVTQLLAQFHVPGLSIAIIDNGKVTSKGYGLGRFPDTPATPKTLYYTGSTTKAMTAATLGLAIHDASKRKTALTWQTPVREICDFELQDQCVTKLLTLEDCLSHRSGMSGDDTFYGPWLGSSPDSLTRQARYLGALSRPFRTAFQYNNWMYAVAGDVLEKVSGMNVGQAVREWLWRPAGMSRSSWALSEIFENDEIVVQEDMSRGYFWVERGGEEGYYVPEKFLDLAGITPAGATISSALDYARWMDVLICAGEGSKSVISNTLFRELTTARSMEDIDPLHMLPGSQITPMLYALGWMSVPSTLGLLHPILTHGGGLNGYGTELWIMPNDKFGVVTMGNTDVTSNIVGAILTMQLVAARFGLKERGREEELKSFWSSTVGHPSFDSRTLAALVPESTEVAGDEAKKPEHDESASTDQETVDLRQYEGIYYCQSHGDFKVQAVPIPFDSNGDDEDIQHRKIVFKSQVLEARYTNNQVHPKNLCLQVDPMHDRTWKWSWILQAAGINKDSKGVHNFDQMFFRGHGMFDGDITEGVPTGAEDGNPDGICRKEDIWEGIILSKLGAALEDSRQSKNLRLGLTLANDRLMGPANRERDWKSKMVWFDRVGGL